MLYQFSIATVHYPSTPLVFPISMDLTQSNSENSNGYENNLHNNNMQLKELQFYIKNHKLSRYSLPSKCKDKYHQ